MKKKSETIEKEKVNSKRPRKTKENSDKINQKQEKPKAEEPRINSEEPDLATKRKLLSKLKQQPNWEDRSIKECQKALEEVNWDYNALFVKKKRRKKVVEEIPIIEEEEVDDEPVIPVEEEKSPEYIPGLDSAWVLKYRSYWRPSELNLLDIVNKKLGTSYESWNELSEKHEDLSEEFLTQYEGYVSFYHLFKTHNPDNYSEKFKKKMKDHFLIADLDLVPRNYKRQRDEKDIQED